MPNIWRVLWTTKRPFSGKFSPRPLGFPKTKLRTKFEVPSSSSFEDYVLSYAKNCGSHVKKMCSIVTRPKPCTFWGKLFMRLVVILCEKLRTKFQVCTSTVLKICSIVCQKFHGSCDLNHTPFGENYLCACSGFPRWSCVQNLKFVA